VQVDAPAQWVSGENDEELGYDLVPRLDFVLDARLLAGFRFGALLAATAR